MAIQKHPLVKFTRLRKTPSGQAFPPKGLIMMHKASLGHEYHGVNELTQNGIFASRFYSQNI